MHVIRDLWATRPAINHDWFKNGCPEGGGDA
jgi:hypothetical protein